MKHKALLVGLLSLLVPGLGQIAAGKRERGAAILLAVILAGSLFDIWLSVFAGSGTTPGDFIGHTLPIILHDVLAFYGIVFWVWQVVDAIQIAKETEFSKREARRS